MGRLADYVEAGEEGRSISAEDIKTKVIPDLLVYAVWLAQEFGVDIETAYIKRFRDNLARLHFDRVSGQELEEIDNLTIKRISG